MSEIIRYSVSQLDGASQSKTYIAHCTGAHQCQPSNNATIISETLQSFCIAFWDTYTPASLVAGLLQLGMSLVQSKALSTLPRRLCSCVTYLLAEMVAEQSSVNFVAFSVEVANHGLYLFIVEDQVHFDNATGMRFEAGSGYDRDGTKICCWRDTK